MPETLAKTIRAKYPGVYDDIGDAALETKVRAKFPGAYDDFPSTPSGAGSSSMEASAPSSLGGSFSEFGGGVNETANPMYGVVDALKQLYDMGPVDAVKDIPRGVAQFVSGVGAKQGDEFVKARKAYGDGNYLASLQHTAAWLTPLVGPVLSDAVELAKGGNWARASGRLTGVVLPWAVGAASKVAPNAPKTASVRPARLTNTNPVERAAMADAMSRGLPVDLGTVAGNPTLRTLAQQIDESTVAGMVGGPEAKAKMIDGLTQWGRDTAQRVDPSPATPFSAGASVVSELDAKIHQLASESRDAYATFRQLIEEKGQERVSAKSAGAKAETAPNPVGPDGYLIDAPPPEKGVVIAAPVNIKAIKAQLAPVVKSMESTWAKVKLESSAPYTAMKALLSRPDVVPLFDAEEALGAFKSITRGAEADLFTQGQGRAASVISQLDREIRTKAAAVSPEAAEALVEGRRLTHSKFVTAEVKDLLRADEPGNLYKQLVQGQDTAVNRLKMVQQEAPTAMPQIGRAVVESMLTKMTEMGGFKQAASVLAEWRRIGPQTKELLIPDAQVRQQITNWLVAAERVGEIENKSGTGKARAIMTTKATLGAAGGMLMSGMPAAALGTVGGVILGEAASVGIAKALRNPNVIRALTEDLVTPRRLRAGSNAGTWPAVGAASMIRQGSAELPAGATVEDRTRARLSTAPPRR